MKFDNENTIEIKKWLNAKGLQPSGDVNVAFDFYVEKQYFGEITKSTSVKDRIRVFMRQIDFIHKSMINLMYENNNFSAKGLRSGYVYAIHNPAWENYIKVGCAIDVYDRLNTYQTSSPLRDFRIIEYVFVEDRLKVESEIHSQFESKGEWVIASEDEIKTKLRSYKNYPDNKIREFCFREALKEFSKQKIHLNEHKKTFRNALKQFKQFFDSVLNVEDFDEYIERKENIKINKSFVYTKCGKVKMCLKTGAFTF